MSENLKAYENEIRADERKRVGRALEALYKRALKAVEIVNNLAADLGKFNDAHHPVERSNGSAPQVKTKRKPVTAGMREYEAVRDALNSISGGTPVTIKNIAHITNLGSKIIGAALRVLVAEGDVIEQPRGKFRDVAQPAGTDGAGGSLEGEVMLTKESPCVDLFWAKVDKNGPYAGGIELGRCWVWTAGVTSDAGYGSWGWSDSSAGRKRKTVRAHRFAYEQLVGPIPSGLDLDHLCRNPPCVNPAHLEPVTNKENILRGTAPSARNATKEHCLNGHPFDERNTYMYGKKRQCRTCSNARLRNGRNRRAREARIANG